jgi:acyl-CoA reductase-like NAD-dependent aldehyde dehydrogenase
MRPFIGGCFVNLQAESSIDIINPTTQQRLGTIADCPAAVVNQAVTAARTAFSSSEWSGATPMTRKDRLRQFAALIRRHAPELNLLDALEMGKPVSSPMFDANTGAGYLEYAIEYIDKCFGEVVPSDRDSHVLKVRRPRGVVGGIIPWNFPTFNALLKIAPALTMGNTIVLKPSELASLSALRLAQLSLEAGLPPGVLNVVTGSGPVTGKALASHPDVDLLTFTGSTQTGRRIIEYSVASGMKPVILECGGKSPNIVFPDISEPDAVAQRVALGAFWNSGQVCSASTRLLVHRDIYDGFVAKVVNAAKGMLPADPTDPHTMFGPVVSVAQLGKVLAYIAIGVDEGARLLSGGERLVGSGNGNFVTPTIFTDVRPDMRIAQEEIFGPVLSVIPFASEEDAVRIANSTMYGLTATVWTGSLATGHRMAEALEAGAVFVNSSATYHEGSGLGFSAEPWKMSGFGIEFGTNGIESHTKMKAIMFHF